MTDTSTERTPLLYRLYERRLQRELRDETLPHHVAVVVDGNRRWAKRQNDDVSTGHRVGAAKVSQFLEWCDELGISVVTLYLLSNGNLTGRATEELHELFHICAELAEDLSHHDEWVIRHVGALEGLPPELTNTLNEVITHTAGRDGLVVNLAIGYGGRREISDAVKQIVIEHQAAGGTLDDLTSALSEEAIHAHLYTGGIPDPDLVLRTSGEQRISDFLLWQSANSEFYFADALWPDFRRVDFLRALRSFAGRQRRFGK